MSEAGEVTGVREPTDVSGRFRAAFDIDPGIVHLNSAGVAPLCRPAREAVERCATLLARRGSDAIDVLRAEMEQAHVVFAQLTGAARDNVAMAQTCAAALSLVAFGFPLRPGDEIVRWDQEYSSNAYPWHAAAQRAGAQVRVVATEPDLSLQTAKLIDAIGPRTRVVTASWVQFQSGAVTDLPSVAEACRRHGAWLVVDAFQGLGVMPFDLRAMGADVVCGGTHKWLCGPVGQGFVAFADGRAEALTPVLQGALTYGNADEPFASERPMRPGARRFEPGSPPLLPTLAAAAGVRLLLDIGVSKLQGVALRLADRLEAELRARGLRVLPRATGACRSPIVTFVPRAPLPQLLDDLRRHHICCAPRAGGVRVAPHAFNQDAEIDRLLSVLDEQSSSR